MGTVTAGSYGSTTAVFPARALCMLGPRAQKTLKTMKIGEKLPYDAHNAKTDKPLAESCWWVECVRAELEEFPRGGRV